MRRTDDSQPFDLATVDKLPRDQAGLDGFADANIVGDEEPDGVQLERHEQWHQLISAWLDVEITETPKGPGAGPEFQAKRIPQEEGRFLRTRLIRVRQVKRRRHRCLGLERQIDERGIVFCSAKRPKLQKIGAQLGQNDPIRVHALGPSPLV